jgi:hypothetical protein
LDSFLALNEKAQLQQRATSLKKEAYAREGGTGSKMNLKTRKKGRKRRKR